MRTLGHQTLPQDGGQSGVIWRVNDSCMGARRMGFRFVSHDRHNKRIGASAMEVIGQTHPDGLGEQMAEQQDAAAAHADLEESGTFALDPDDIVTNRRDDPPARAGQFPVGTDMQDGSGAAFHATLMTSDTRSVVGSCIFGFSAQAGCILRALF